MIKRTIALSIAVLAVGILVPTGASAAAFNSSVTIRIVSIGNGFTGKVSSPKAGCQSSRVVTLERKLAGQTSFHAVGTDHSSLNGTWEVTSAPVASAKYRAVVNTKRLNASNTCKATVSVTTTARNTTTTIVQGANNFHGRVLAGGRLRTEPACGPAEEGHLSVDLQYGRR